MPNTDSKLKTVGWDDINWRKAERAVYKLQKRIYAASRRGDVKQVRKLQKTLMSSWSNKVLSVRKVTQDNRGKKTAGVDGIKVLSPEARMNLIGQLKITGKSKPTRRVWIPKPGKDEKRPLGIPTIHDRALQNVVKMALEPEWEAQFEPNSYGFRPGRNCHDAIWSIKNSIQTKPKFVLDADIAKCFDRINHLALLQKLGYTGKIRQQIKAWLKSGVIDQGVFTATSEGTMQGGVISPLLANIALHGLEQRIKEFAKTLDMRRNDKPNSQISWQQKVKSLTFIRYADDFVLIHKDLSVVQRCRELISEWLKDIGLELKPSKTRIAHTLNSELSEDGLAGFDFLGYHIRQFPVGKHRSSIHPSTKEKLGFRTLITPSKDACKKHQLELKRVINKHKYSHQALLIKELNPIIRGWTNYYQFSNAQTVGELTRQDYLLFQKLRAWSRHRTGDWYKARRKYWTKIGNKNWVFATRQGDANPLRLLTHTEFGSSGSEYVKVKGEDSPFNGNLVYWSTRMGKHPNMPTRKASLLKKQKGKCPWCCLHFREEDTLEVDHILATALGGKDTYKNLQLLHGHCHDEKTAIDMVDIRKHQSTKRLKLISQELNKSIWFWEDDILVTSC
ncbi:MAG: group II intron reverse transcriptase/maturase [Oscillatoria sp. PMC 1051.18]|nr:group II intron reverse transcriptase/maturase [Oscillatoria sp. PMC 1050.18]MEC5033314.1 group II intron reverse transcriptase/maturase [Oscillatoria sp. PMC 1051.18]